MDRKPSSQRIGYYPQQQSAPTPPQRPAAQGHAASRPPQRAPKRSAPSRTGRPRKRRRLRLNPRALLLLICAGVFVTCAFLLVRYFVNIAVTRQASQQLEEAYSAAMQSTDVPAQPTPEPSAAPTSTALPLPTASTAPLAEELWPDRYPSNPSLRVSSVFYELQRQNADIVGWLKIDGVLEEAVLQRDNSYYLTHNALGQRSVTGALFLDEGCDLRTVPTQMLIHGHNMKEGAMFGSLKKYKVKDASFYRAHPFIDFNTIYENGRYVIFAVAEVDLRYGQHDYLPFWRDVRFSSADAFVQYVEKAQSLSHYHCNVDVQPGDRLLTLSTCTGTDDNKRLLVMARKLRDNEDALELNISILSTDDR